MTPSDTEPQEAVDPLPEFRRKQDIYRMAGAKPRASLVMIARNAEATIRRAIRRALPLVGEVIVVLDSRTTDRTLQVAQDLGAVIVERDWDGFAGQRNFAHGLAEGRWHLILDADETIDLGDLDEAIDEADKQDADGIAVTVLLESRPGQLVPMRQIRVVRAGRTKWVYRRQNELVGASKTVPSTAVIRNSYVDRLPGIAAAAIPELEAMYDNPTETAVTPDEEKGHAAVFLTRSYFDVGELSKAREWARLVPSHLPPDHLKCVMAGIVEAWATLFLDGPAAAEAFARARMAVTLGVAEYHYIVAAIQMTSCALAAMNAGPYALIPQGCLAHLPRFPEAFEMLGFPFQINFDHGYRLESEGGTR